jgi:hypothetical protein
MEGFKRFQRAVELFRSLIYGKITLLGAEVCVIVSIADVWTLCWG